MKKKLFARLWAYQQLNNQRGQGILEYILMLVIGVLIMLGMIYQLNTAFASYLDNYFGSYLACLIETGELPSLGGQGITQGQCDSLFQPFNLSDGRPLIEASDYEPGGNNSRGGRGGGGRRAGRFSRYGGGGNAENSVRNLRRSTQITSLGGGGGGDRETTESAASSGEGGSLSRRSQRFIRRRYALPSQFVVRRGITKRFTRRKIKAAKRKDIKAVLRKKRQKFMPPDRKLTGGPKTDTNVGFTFSTLLRWLIIIGIGIALGVFLGGQILQIRKSWEKAE